MNNWPLRTTTSLPPTVRLGQEISLVDLPVRFPTKIQLNRPVPDGALVLDGDRFYGRVTLRHDGAYLTRI